MSATTLTVNRVRHSLAVTLGWGRPGTGPAGLGLPLAVARDLYGARAGRAPEVAAPADTRAGTRRASRARVRG